MSLRIGIQIGQQHADYSELRDAWRRADELGVDAIYGWDHFYPVWGDPAGKHFEGWTLLAAIAEVTEQARLGILVSCTSYRNPNLLADMARTVDHISGGRLILGIGAGWVEHEYRDFGYRFGSARERLVDLEQALSIIRERLRQLNPPPLQRRVPILIGAGGEKVALRIVAEHADIWNTYGERANILRRNSVLDEWCARAGRDPGEIARSVAFQSDELRHVDTYASEGFQELIIVTSGPSLDLAPLRELLEWRASKAG